MKVSTLTNCIVHPVRNHLLPSDSVCRQDLLYPTLVCGKSRVHTVLEIYDWTKLQTWAGGW